MSRHSADWWAKRVEELAKERDAEVVASRHKVRVRTLVWWRAELARRAREAVTPGPRLLPVVVESPRGRSAVAGDGSIEVVVEAGAARVAVRGALTADHLVAVVGKILERC